MTWGAWDYEKGGWVNRLRLFIDKTDEDSFIYNLSIFGETSSDLIKRFEQEIFSREPESIILFIGGNDLMYIKSENSLNVELDEFEKNIYLLIKKASKITSQVIVVGLVNVDESRTTPVEWENDYYYMNENIIKYNNAWQKACTKYDIPFIDIYGILDKSDFEDGLLPNSKGHEKVFRVIKDFIEQKYL